MKEVRKYQILTFIRYFADAMFYPFFSLYLKSLGLVEDRVGFILSITPLTSIFASMCFSRLCSNLVITKRTLNVISFLEAIVIGVICFSSDFYLISCLTLLLALFGSCHYSLLDSLSVNFCNNNNLNFSSIRMFGSISYVLSTTISGFVIEAFGYSTCFLGCGLFFMLSGFFYGMLRPVEIKRNFDGNLQNSKPSVKSLFKNKDFMIYLVMYVIFVSSLQSCDSFLSIYFNSLGVSSSTYGIIYSYYVLVEVVGMIYFNIKHKASDSFNPCHLFIIGAICIFIRMMCNLWCGNLALIIILTGLKGIVNAIVFSYMFVYLVKLVGAVNSTLAILIVNIFHNVVIFVGNNAFGNAIKHGGYHLLYVIGVALSVLAILITVINYINLRDKRVS